MAALIFLSILMFQLEGLFDFFDEPGFCNLDAHFYHIQKGMWRGYAMTYDNRFIDTKNGCATIIFIVVAPEIFVGKPAFFHDLVYGFCCFKYHIAGKTIAYDNISFITEEIVAFYIAYKIETCTVFKQRVSGL